MKKLVQRIKFTRLWLMALKQASLGHFESVLEHLQSMPQSYMTTIPEALVLEVTMLSKLDRLDDALARTMPALEAVGRSKSIRAEEKKYLAFVLWCSVGTRDEAQLIFKKAGYDKSLVDTGITGVSKRMLQMFPLQERPPAL